MFEPRMPLRLGKGVPQHPVVWTIDAEHLPLFLTPRDCPRVAYHRGPGTTAEDHRRFFASMRSTFVVAIEAGWFERMISTRLFLYEMQADAFTLQDANAGYYVSQSREIPIKVQEVASLPEALFARHAEMRVMDSLWDLAEAVQASTLHWSLCRMSNAARK